MKGQLECVRHLEAIVTHQVSQDRSKVEKMQQRAKKDLDKRLKERQKLLKTIDKSYDKKAAKQRKYIGVPLNANPNNPYNLDGTDKMSFSQLTGMSNGHHHHHQHPLDRSNDDEMHDEYDDDSIDSFQRVEDEFLTRTSQISDDIVFERPEKSSIKTDQTDLSGGSSTEMPIRKSAGMVASLNSLHSKNKGGYNRSMDRGYTNGNNGYPTNNQQNGYPRKLSSMSGGSVIDSGKRTANGKGFGSSQHLGASMSSSKSGNLPPSKRTGRPVGYREVHMGPLYTFLHSLGMDEFRDVFLREKIDLSACLLCDEKDLREIGLPLGPRKKLIDAINKRNQVMREASEKKKELLDSAV